MQPPKTLPRFENPPENAKVRALFCEDSQGQVQVIAPERSLVDPDPICQTTARELRSLPVSETEPVCAIPGTARLVNISGRYHKLGIAVKLHEDFRCPGDHFALAGDSNTPIIGLQPVAGKFIVYGHVYGGE